MNIFRMYLSFLQRCYLCILVYSFKFSSCYYKHSVSIIVINVKLCKNICYPLFRFMDISHFIEPSDSYNEFIGKGLLKKS